MAKQEVFGKCLRRQKRSSHRNGPGGGYTNRPKREGIKGNKPLLPDDSAK